MSMMGTRPVALTLAAVAALCNAGCAALDVDDYCRYAESAAIRGADPESLALLLGVKAGHATKTPFVVIRSRAETASGAALTLQTTPAAHPMPIGLDESRCERVDWKTYTLVVDPEEWHAFWQDERNTPYEIGIVFLEGNSPLQLSAFGTAILDTRSADYLVACGCFWR